MNLIEGKEILEERCVQERLCVCVCVCVCVGQSDSVFIAEEEGNPMNAGLLGAEPDRLKVDPELILTAYSG